MRRTTFSLKTLVRAAFFAAATILAAAAAFFSCTQTAGSDAERPKTALHITGQPASAAYYSGQAAVPLCAVVKAEPGNGSIHYRWLQTDAYDEANLPVADGEGTPVCDVNGRPLPGASGELDPRGGFTELCIDDAENAMKKPSAFPRFPMQNAKNLRFS